MHESAAVLGDVSQVNRKHVIIVNYATNTVNAVGVELLLCAAGR